MKLLVLSVTSGEGHNAMGKAVIEEFEKRGHQAKMIDYLKPSSPLRSFFAQDFYFFTLKHFPKMSHKLYLDIANRNIHEIPSKLSAFHYMTNGKKTNNTVIKEINKYKPDVIYCTHVYTACLISKLKKAGKITCPSFFIVSDYTIHGYTELTTNIDYLLTPNSDFDKLLMEMGFKKEQLLPLGITVKTKFSNKLNKDELCEKYSLKKNILTIMLISGAVGFGKTFELVKKITDLNGDLQLIVVNGKNEKSFKKIEKFIKEKNIRNIYNFGFVNNVDELMELSDIMIGKIGGVGITEAFNKNLPIICSTIPPFQEYDNGIYLERKNVIINAQSIEKTISALENIINDKSILSHMKENIEKIAKPNATRDFVNFVEEMIK
ncbi:MAG: glycosyltransferase [Bacilli bacterium]|nr:glycosyltransferase [Bacilli bacterium]